MITETFISFNCYYFTSPDAHSRSLLCALDFFCTSECLMTMFGNSGSFWTQRWPKPCFSISVLVVHCFTRKRFTGFILCCTIVYKNYCMVSDSYTYGVKPSRNTCLKLTNRLNCSIDESLSSTDSRFIKQQRYNPSVLLPSEPWSDMRSSILDSFAFSAAFGAWSYDCETSKSTIHCAFLASLA